MYGIEWMRCACGGEVEYDDTTKEEDEKDNCPHGCCLTAIKCKKCGIRILIKEEAPEAWVD